MQRRIPIPADGDWPGLRRALALLANVRLADSAPQIFSNLTLTDLSASSLVVTDADKKLVSTNSVDGGDSNF